MLRITKVLLGVSLLSLIGCSSKENQNTVAEIWTGPAPEASAILSTKSRYLSSLSDDPSAQFELGIVEAMRAIEVIYQYRYKHFSGELPLTPGGISNLPTNPDAQFDPAFIENAMKEALVHLALAETALKTASGKDFSVVLDADDFWFDIDEDGKRSDHEGLTHYLPAILGEPIAMRDDEVPNFDPIRFDTADADWALAYVHTLSGMAEMVLAMEPTPAIDKVVSGREALFADKDAVAVDVMGIDSEVDSIAALLLVMRGKPNSARTSKAHDHFLAMIDANRDFWQRVEKETDNDREWLPNSNQTSAFGVQVSSEMAEQWQDVLKEIEDVLKGEKLVPYWRVASRDDSGPQFGLNMKKMFNNFTCSLNFQERLNIESATLQK